MHYSTELKFVIELLNKLRITSHIITEPKHYIPSEIDGGLREMIHGENDYSKILVNSPSEAKDNTVYRFFDEYRCGYLFFKMPYCEKESYFFVGPYLSELPSDEYVLEKSSKLSICDEKTELLFSYYRSLPIVEDENLLISIIDTLGVRIWNGLDNFSISLVNYEISDKLRPVSFSNAIEPYDKPGSKLSLEIIEQNYQNEKTLMDAVSKGKLNKIDIIVNSVLNKGTERRLSDSLRNRKNYLIILNTLLRKAAEYGAVHPYHLHILSSSFANQIEQLHSIEDSVRLQKNMIIKYCILVKEHSLKRFSNLVGKVITLISYDLTADLSLKSISASLNVNSSYLSALFKKECGQTLTDYVNRKRMENAAMLLTHSDKQIQDIAEECGILDVNYFIKLFKRYYKITPSKYRSTVIK